MRKTAIIGVGMTAVGEHWGTSLRDLAADAASQAFANAATRQVDALFVGNTYGATFNNQTQMGALLGHYLGMRGVEASTIEAGSASGGLALRQAYIAVASGAIETAMVLGVEKATDIVAGARVKATTISLDADQEAIHGATLTALAALLMRRYMHETGTTLAAFEGFSLNAHANGKRNPLAMYRNALKVGAFANAPMIAEPVSLFDSAPDGDGAAAVIITSLERSEDISEKPIQILGSGVATDTLALQDRGDLLALSAVTRSTELALRQANLNIGAISAIELHDAYTILSVLSLEAMKLAERGQGWQWAENSGAAIALNGRLPISTFGGLKSRGNPSGATGVYQAVEATLQLRGEAGANQISNPDAILIQNMGGLGSTVATHILSR